MSAPSREGDQLTARFREISATASFNTWAGFEVVRMAEGECELTMSWRAAEMGQYAEFLAPALGDSFIASGRVVKAGRKQIFTAGELCAVGGGQSRLVATATAILVPAG